MSSSPAAVAAPLVVPLSAMTDEALRRRAESLVAAPVAPAPSSTAG